MKSSRKTGSIKRPFSSKGSSGSRAMSAPAYTPVPEATGMPLALYRLTRSIPQLGEPFFKMYPQTPPMVVATRAA
jgi:hypothetical protein